VRPVRLLDVTPRPLLAVEQTVETIRPYELAIANSPNGEALQHALATLGLAIASALVEMRQLHRPV
jgi:hypothetical protein